MVRYAEMIRPTAKFDTRVRVAQYALKHGVSAAARTFGTTRNTIRLWLARYNTKGARSTRSLLMARS